MDYLKKVVETIIIMICEATCLNPIKNRIFSKWPSPDKLDNTLTQYMVLWCSVPMLIAMSSGMSWTHSGRVDELKDMGITTIKEIGIVID